MPEPTVGTWLLMVGFGGLLALDDAGWPQAMVSRPFVAAALGGWVAGDAAGGMAVGAVLELLLLPHQPLGGVRCPDPGPASFVAGVAAAAAGFAPAALLGAVIAGWAVAWTGTVTVLWHRRLAAHLIASDAETHREPRSVEQRHLLSLTVGFLRGALLAAVWWIPVTLFVRALASPTTAGPAGLPLAAFAIGLAAAGVAGSTTGRTGARVAAPAGAAVAAAVLWGAA